MRCAESLRVQAYFDAEVDAVSAADIERHLEHCAECRALLQDLEQVRTVLRRDSAYVRTPSLLRAKIMSALDQENAAETPVAEGTPAAEGAHTAVLGGGPQWCGGCSHCRDFRIPSPRAAVHQSIARRTGERACALADAVPSHRRGIHR